MRELSLDFGPQTLDLVAKSIGGDALDMSVDLDHQFIIYCRSFGPINFPKGVSILTL